MILDMSPGRTRAGWKMQFAKQLRDRVRTGEITCSVRIWRRPHVKVGNAYALPPGHVVVDSIMEIALSDVTPELARRSGFKGVVDLLKTAKHGAGERVFLVEFHYVEDTACATVSANSPETPRSA